MSALPQVDLTIEQFETGRINPERFDHEAHVYVAWLYVQAYEQAEAIARFDSALKRLTLQLGIPGKYHATITWFFLLLIGDRCRDNEGWQAFCSRNQDLINDSKAILRRYYSNERLFSEAARTHFVLPDKLVN
ncbi:MAG: hypothetical protein GY785_24255 [Gammaproteobacteria bacterium]|nr:hypothetical protein [Gammaproteobacteria bacterium]